MCSPLRYLTSSQFQVFVVSFEESNKLKDFLICFPVEMSYASKVTQNAFSFQIRGEKKTLSLSVFSKQTIHWFNKQLLDVCCVKNVVLSAREGTYRDENNANKVCLEGPENLGRERNLHIWAPIIWTQSERCFSKPSEVLWDFPCTLCLQCKC